MSNLAVIDVPATECLSGSERFEAAEKVVRRYVKISAGSGLIPVPVWDAAAIFGVHVALVRELSKLYDVPFSEAKVKHLVGALIGGLGAPILGHSIIGSMVKAIPGIGTVGGILTVPALAAGSAYATGRVFIQHFESGGTFLSFDPKAVEDYYLQKFEEGKAAVKSQVAKVSGKKKESASSEAIQISERTSTSTPSDPGKSASPSKTVRSAKSATSSKATTGRGSKTSSTSKKDSKNS